LGTVAAHRAAGRRSHCARESATNERGGSSSQGGATTVTWSGKLFDLDCGEGPYQGVRHATSQVAMS
jgi:hypothetical protein